MCDSYLKCNYCGELFGWESGHPIKGNIYPSEGM